MPIVVTPLVREATKGRAIGRPRSVLEEAYGGESRLVWDGVDDAWIEAEEDCAGVPARAAAARAFLLGLPHSIVVLITHGTFFKTLAGVDFKLVNGEVRLLTLEPGAPAELSDTLFALPSARHGGSGSEGEEEEGEEEESIEDLARLLITQIRASDWLEQNMPSAEREGA